MAAFAKRIEEVLRGQEKLFAGNPETERLATQYAQKLLRKYKAEYREGDEKPYESIDLVSLSHSRLRSVGTEYGSLAYFKRLEFKQ
ncbi:MAG: hypothetical protein ACE5HS_09620 [bacterium]